MNFFQKWLKNQRNKSEIEAKNTAFFISLAITSIIFLVWIFTVLNTGFNANNSASNSPAGNHEAAKPLDALMSNVKSIFDN